VRSPTSARRSGSIRKEARAYSNRGLGYHRKGDYDRAVADFDQAISLDPKAGEAYHRRGDTRFNKGEYDRAIADYDQAIALDPNEDVIAYRGLVYLAKGDYDRAIADFDQATALNPSDCSARSSSTVRSRPPWQPYRTPS
jgi:tetratricopeptide (TPR) repeat protein